MEVEEEQEDIDVNVNDFVYSVDQNIVVVNDHKTFNDSDLDVIIDNYDNDHKD